MPDIPLAVRRTIKATNGCELTADAYIEGWDVVHEGKVRITFADPHVPNSYVVVATDRVSIFDFVLNAEVDGKGEVLTALTHFWWKKLLEGRYPHQFSTVPIPAFFPPGRSLRVDKHEMLAFEMIYRYHLGGSRWGEYQKTGKVAGQFLPQGLRKWGKLQFPLFTPSTKAETGHDQPLDAGYVTEATGTRGKAYRMMLQRIYEEAYAFAYERGLVILDTKFEISRNGVVCDELLTGDSSRVTTIESLKKVHAEGQNGNPEFLDKQRVREWGETVPTPFVNDETGQPIVGFSSLKPENPDHVAFVHSQTVPEEVLQETARQYHGYFEVLTGMSVSDYQRNVMGIAA